MDFLYFCVFRTTNTSLSVFPQSIPLTLTLALYARGGQTGTSTEIGPLEPDVWTSASVALQFFGFTEESQIYQIQVRDLFHRAEVYHLQLIASNDCTYSLANVVFDDLSAPDNTSSVLGTAVIHASSVVRTVDTRIFGLNTATWDNLLSGSASAISQAGFTTLRYPGGSSSDEVWLS